MHGETVKKRKSKFMRRVVGKQARKIEVEREKRQELQYLGG